jgi:hypothetical protein
MINLTRIIEYELNKRIATVEYKDAMSGEQRSAMVVM